MQPDAGHVSDRQLAEQWQNGNASAFEQLFARYYAPLVRFAYRTLRDQETAEDVVQNVFGHLWALEGNIQMTVSVRSYLYTAVRNAAISHVRHRGVRTAFEDRIDHDILQAAQPDALEDLQRRELQQRVRRALRRFTEEQQTLIFLKWHDELTNREIGAIVRLSEKAVERRLSRLTEKLRRLL